MDAVSVLSIVIGSLGLLISGVAAGRLYSPLMSVLAVATVSVGSSVLIDVFWPHSLGPSLSLACVAFAVAAALREPDSTRRWIAVSIVATAALAVQRGDCCSEIV